MVVEVPCNVIPFSPIAFVKAAVTIATVFLILSFAYVLWENLMRKAEHMRG